RTVHRPLAANSAAPQLDTSKAELLPIPGLFDALECVQFIAMSVGVAKPSMPYQFENASGYRSSYSGNLDPVDTLVRKTQARIDDLLGLESSWGETLQEQRYTQGQEFKPHNDWYSASTPAWETEKARGGQRSITAMAYLNAVEAGGETDFPRLNVAVK